MQKYTKEIDKLYDWATENGLIRLSDETSFRFPKDKSKILEIEALNLSDSELTEISNEIGCLTNLKILKVSNTKLKKLPPNIVRLKNIESICFDCIVKDNLLLCQQNWIYKIKKSSCV